MYPTVIVVLVALKRSHLDQISRFNEKTTKTMNFAVPGLRSMTADGTTNARESTDRGAAEAEKTHPDPIFTPSGNTSSVVSTRSYLEHDSA